jgi:hypothetical protein
MSDREILFRSLAPVAARLSWSRRVPELGQLAFALVALELTVEVLKVLGAPAQVLSALAPLLGLTVLAVALLFVWRIARPTTLAQAAGAADIRAGLRDELKSAYWFAQRPARDAFVEVLVARAAQTAQALDISRLIPLGVPRSALVALVLALLAGALAWFSPRLNWATIQASASASAPAAAGQRSDRFGGGDELGKMAAKEDIGTQTALPDAATMRDQNATWAQLEQEAGQLPAGTDEDAIRRAVAARDARLVSKLLQALRHKQADAAELDQLPRTGDEPIPVNTGQGTLERMQEALEKGGKPVEVPSADDFAEPTARVTQRLREEAEEERRKITGTPAEGDVELNPRMRAVTRTGVAMREVQYAAGEGAEAGPQTSAEGNATGQADGKGRSGGSSGEHPEASFTNAFDPTPVLGAPTVRLEVQLQKVRVERADDPEQEATKEEFYAETQRRASQVEYESAAVQWRAQRETLLQPGQTPFAYREAVKRYFLTQHGREK